MTDERVRGYAQSALIDLDWIDEHACARRMDNDEQMEARIDSLRRTLLRLIGANQH